MNLGIYRSRHALCAVLVVAALAIWHWSDARAFGSRDHDNVAFLLTTGWVAVLCYVVLALYAVRRAAHRLRLSPEFAWKAKLPDLERAQSQLMELQNRVTRRELAGRKNVLSAAAAILQRHGVQRVLRVDVEPDARALGLLHVRVAPREPLGRLASWLHAHVYYGFAAAAIVWFHGGLRSATTMGFLLNALSCLVIGSGLLGAFFWTFGPTWLTRAEREVSIEKAHALAAHYDRKVAEASAAVAAAKPEDAPAGTDALRLGHELATLQGQRERVRAEQRRLDVYRNLLRFWRLFHVPCSILLLALVAVHVLSIWYY